MRPCCTVVCQAWPWQATTCSGCTGVSKVGTVWPHTACSGQALPSSHGAACGLQGSAGSPGARGRHNQEPHRLASFPARAARPGMSMGLLGTARECTPPLLPDAPLIRRALAPADELALPLSAACAMAGPRALLERSGVMTCTRRGAGAAAGEGCSAMRQAACRPGVPLPARRRPV